MTDPDTTQLEPRAREGTPFGQLMREKRETLGLSQARAALYAGISQARWRQLECGYQEHGKEGSKIQVATTARADTVKKIAACLEWDQREALEAHGLAPDDKPATTSIGVTFLGLLHDLSEPQRHQLLGVMRDMRVEADPDADLMAEAS